MKKYGFLFIVLIFLFTTTSKAQLKEGFEPNEYEEILGIFAHSITDSSFSKGIPKPKTLIKESESPTVGLENKWYLWVNKTEKLAVFSIRGTIPNPTSWLANFYSAMIPAQGKMKFRTDYTFEYNFSKDPKAYVHVGWTLSTGALAESLLPKMEELTQMGYRDFIITGHSQGGAITYLMAAMLMELNDAGAWGEKLRIKVYASAAPKPGNLNFAYDYENRTMGGWAFNVVNAADWVPEVPFSIQTVNDFSETNPFSDVSGFIKQQKFPKNIVFKKVYNKLDKPTKKSQQNFEKYLGEMAGKQVLKTIPEFQAPQFVESNHYSRAGTFIVLQPDQEYKKRFPDLKEKIFQHHMLQPYYYLFKKQFFE
ncbi:MAG: lipase family protein [Algoriphagus sp.]|uniref:lipase family protein n=1 Tax=Algoriphagus sp. TaxID=1872435 RepID=UPI00261CE45B|nr:lipase family protein [Algoriphagus sp.]MDG1276104.1 lipase family protein [Algoriphagus sp.]